MENDPKIRITDFRGGISSESSRGPRGSFWFGQALDIRNGDNTLKCNQAMKKDTGTVIVGKVNVMMKTSSGFIVAGDDAGNIYYKDHGSPAAWNLIYTDSNGAITGMAEYVHDDGGGNQRSFIVWATPSKLREVNLVYFPSISTHTQDAGVFYSGGIPDFHTMRVEAGSLMIADGAQMAMLDSAAVFNSQALVIEYPNEMKALYERNDQILIGTDGNAFDGWIFTWDGIQDSWITRKPLQGSSANAMLPLEAGMVVQVGSTGEFKYFNYADVSPLFRVRDAGLAIPGGASTYKGVPHFALSGGALNAVYSIGRINKNDPISLVLSYIPSHGVTGTGSTLGALFADGDDLYLAWKLVSGGTTYGIDITDTANKAVATYESLEFDAGAIEADKLNTEIKLISKGAVPTGCSVTVKYKGNRDTDWTLASREDGGDTMAAGEYKAIFNGECQGETIKFQLTLTPSGNNGPEIRAIIPNIVAQNDE